MVLVCSVRSGHSGHLGQPGDKALGWVYLLAFLAAVAPVARGQDASSDADAIYAYVDDLGRLVHVQRLQDVPLRLRDSAKRVDILDEPAGAGSGSQQTLAEWLSGLGPQASAEPFVYHYRGPHGRPVYTNLESTVPPDQRARARIDLRHVSLNSELGGEINRDLSQRYEALRSSKVCDELRSESSSPWWQRAWRDRRPLVACAGVFLVLLMLTPAMHKRGWGAAWARVLGTAAPLLGFVGVSAWLLLQNEAQLRAFTPRAHRCEQGAWTAAKDLPQRHSLVTALEAERAALERIERESRL